MLKKLLINVQLPFLRQKTIMCEDFVKATEASLKKIKRLRKMQFRMRKNQTIMAISLMLTVTALMVVIPAIAQQDVELDTYLQLSIAPNPAGQGQTVSVNVFFSKPTPSAGVRGVGTIEQGEVYENINVEMMRPDGTEDTFELSRTDQTGGTWFPFTPDQIGTYTFEASYPGQALVAPGYEAFCQ